ncbi:MAG: hypothetical protein SGI84_03395 [Gemmatimonadota bacterium]|nr:hypothetical protein [Gemmatimonadota bacterium]
MSWPASIGVGVLTGLVAGFLAGWIANLTVGWYRMSSFEGASGYFIVGMALLGAIAGLVLGVIVSRTLGSWKEPSFFKALGTAQLSALLLLGAIGGVTRLMADVPPHLNGQTMLVTIELRWPEGRRPTAAPDSAEWYLRLGAVSGSVARASVEGPLWRGDARQEAGRWIVPGAVDVFTSRGKRMLSVSPDDLVGEGFIVPLPGRPGAHHLEWSDWLPLREGVDRFSYRFRVVPSNQPIRTDTAGPFEIDLIANGVGMYSWDGNPMRWTATGHFEIRHQGAPVVIEHLSPSADTTGRFDRFDGVAVVSTLPAALLVQVDGTSEGGSCYLLVTGEAGLRTDLVGRCGSGVRGSYLSVAGEGTSAAGYAPMLTGRLDRESYPIPGSYLLPGVVLDTRTLTFRHFATDELGQVIDRIAPLGIAPDGLSLVRLAWTGDAEQTGLLVVDLEGASPTQLPIDRAVMRCAQIDDIDSAWLSHYFEWGPDSDGRFRLTPRGKVTPLPHRGVLTLDHSGYREYRLSPALESLRPALIEFLVTKFGAERLPAEPEAFSHQVRIGEAIVFVSYRAEDGHVGVWMDRGQDTALVAAIAERFDAALRTLTYDQHFSR